MRCEISEFYKCRNILLLNFKIFLFDVITIAALNKKRNLHSNIGLIGFVCEIYYIMYLIEKKISYFCGIILLFDRFCLFV